MSPGAKPLTSREKKMIAQKIIFNISDQSMVQNTSKQWFLLKCKYLCQADYDDYVQERCVVMLCGYPICSKRRETVQREKYDICEAANDVYDITERKNFCSNKCYRASNFLKAQLHSLPVYMRKIGETSYIYKVLSDSDYREMFAFETEGEENQSKNLNDSDSDDVYIYETNDEEDRIFFPDYVDSKVLSNKHMPISNCKKKAVLIEPVKSIPVKPLNISSAKISLDFLSNVFRDWFTEDTMKYLLGEKQFYSLKADNLFRIMVSSGENKKEKLNALKDEYINLCLQIDKLSETEEELSDTSEVNANDMTKREEIQNNIFEIASEADSKSHSVYANLKRRIKWEGKSKSRSVSFALNSKNERQIETSPEDPDSKCLPEPVFPLVDSISQNTLSRQVLISKLKNVYFDVLALIGLHYRNIKEEVKNIVNTFSLTPTNTIFKPRELKCIGIVLFRILTKTVLKEYDDDAQFTELCENSLADLIISEQEINNLAYDLISPVQVSRLQNAVY